MELIAEKITKSIRGKYILQDVSFSLSQGRVYGFTGRNGSGKTMLFRALSGLMKIDSGSIRWGSRILGKDMEILPELGIVLENAGLYPEFTGRKNLQLLGGIKKKISEQEIDKTIERVGLDPGDKRPYSKYSLGMKQRIIIAQAVMEKPDIIMLDEPTNSLDESGVEQIRLLIKEEKKRGALILLASHNKLDIQLLADEIYHLAGGKCEKNF